MAGIMLHAKILQAIHSAEPLLVTVIFQVEIMQCYIAIHIVLAV